MATLGAPAIAAIVTTIASTAYAAYAQKEASDFQAAQMRRNAEAAEAAARDEAKRGFNEEVKISLVGGATRGSIRAGYAASGIDVASGSPLDILSDAAMFTELDKQTARSNTKRAQYALRTQAGNFLAGARAARYEGYSDAAGTILAGAARVGGDYYSYTKGS